MKNINEISLIIFELMENNPDYLTATQLAEILGVSTRSVLRYINIINANDSQNSFKIVSVPNRGYRLEIYDEKNFDNYKNNILKSDFPIHEHIDLIIETLFKKPKEIQFLSKSLNYSESSINRNIENFNKEFSSEGIIVSRKNNCLEVVGNEIRIRNVMMRTLSLYQEKVLDSIENYKVEIYYKILSFINKHQLLSQLQGIRELLFITWLRNTDDKTIDFNQIMKYVYVDGSLKDDKIVLINEFLNSHLVNKLSEDEQIYLWINTLHEKQDNLDFSDFLNIIEPFINESLTEIDKKFGTSFYIDSFLKRGLTYHISASLIKYLVFKKTENKYIDEIRLNYTNAYCYALELTSLIYKKFSIEIDENDIGYLAIHFATSMEKSDSQLNFDVSIVVKEDLTSARFLKTRIENRFGNLTVKSFINEHELSSFSGDSILITCEDLINNQNIVKVSPFVTNTDAFEINKAILNRIGLVPLEKICHDENFYILDQFDNKHDVLEFLLDDLKSKGYLSADNSISIINRERLSSTEIALNIAFPHVLITSESFLAVAILKQPIIWKENMVRIVLLMGLKENDNEALSAVKYIFKNITDIEKVVRISRTTNFSEFIKELKK